jgi:hypothetical protein
MISFLDFDETAHWSIFIYILKLSKDSADVPMNVFMSKEMIRTFALHLNLEIERFVGATEEIV